MSDPRDTPPPLPLYYVAARSLESTERPLATQAYGCVRCAAEVSIDAGLVPLAQACAAIICSECAHAAVGSLLVAPDGR